MAKYKAVEEAGKAAHAQLHIVRQATERKAGAVTNKHLLWWVFRWLAKSHPLVLSQMLTECDGSFGDSATSTVNAELNAAFGRFESAQ